VKDRQYNGQKKKRRTDNTMAKRKKKAKGKTMIYKTKYSIYRRLDNK
jgi:hypothetical protein